MTPEQVFNIATVFALLGWIVLIFLSSSRTAVEALARTFVPAMLSLAYAAIIIPFVFTNGIGSLGSFEGLLQLQGQPWLLVGGWLHYLAFDLLAGAWQATTAREEGIPRYALIPCLVLTFILGPIGFLVFLVVRWMLGRRW